MAGYLQIAETLLKNNDLCKGKGNLASELFNSCLFTNSEDILKSYSEEFENNNVKENLIFIYFIYIIIYLLLFLNYFFTFKEYQLYQLF